MLSTVTPPNLGSCMWEALGSKIVLRAIDPTALEATRAAVEQAAVDTLAIEAALAQSTALPA